MASEPTDELAIVRQLKEQTLRLEVENDALKGSGGGGTSGGMEARVAKLEAHVEHIQSDLAKLGGLPADVASMKSDIANLPTKDFLSAKFDVQFRWIVGVMTVVVAIVGLLVKVTVN